MLKTYPDVISSLKVPFEQIYTEHHKQFDKWGTQKVSLFEWHNYLSEEVGELAKAIADFEYGRDKGELITEEATQVAALAVKIMLIADSYCKGKKPNVTK